MSDSPAKPGATVAVVLSGQYPYQEARDKLHSWTAEAASEGAEYICFPEYYFDQDREADGSTSRGVTLDGPLVGELKELARTHHIGMVVGLTEKRKNRRFDVRDYYNSALFVDWNGLAGLQRKVFLWVDPDWDEQRRRTGNEGNSDFPYPPLVDEHRRYLPGWSFEVLPFGDLERAAGIICADGLMPQTWSHLIPRSPQIVFYLNGRVNLLKKWGPDLADISLRYHLPIVASNSFLESEAGIFDAGGKLLARLERTEGIAVARVSLAGRQPMQPVYIRHWEGEPLDMLERLDKG